MSERASFPKLDITPIWARLNDGIVRLVDYIPDDKINWSPRPELWNFRGTLLHLADARDNWLAHGFEDGVKWTAVWQDVRSKAEIQEALRRTWRRLEAVLADPAKLEATYNTNDPGEEPEVQSGHWIAYHLLEHDIHHRADVMHYLALLGVEHPDVGTP